MTDSTEAVSSHTSARSAGHEATGPSPQMEGFGNTCYMSPLNYGSVQDGTLYQPTLEQKLKKQYWKTKQAMIQKLGKSQDEFVVAGDAEIDTKLEKAYHLETSCGEILDALEQYNVHMRALSTNELNMGEYLCAYSEEEPTQASSVMKAVGVVQEKVAKQRTLVLPSLLRLHNEFISFMGNALTDLGQSIQRLEKARTDYRAALLWMRDASAKLQNPDHRDELVKFRQVQAQVKDTKKVFERLKYDLSEKIDMVAASRCNLISCSLPYYQKEFLAYLDYSASEYHAVLETLRTYNRDQHQYQETKLVEEIRDLELGEPMASESEPPAHASEQQHRQIQQGNNAKRDGEEDDDDEMLIDVGSAQTQDSTPAQPGGGGASKAKDTAPLQAASSAVSELKDLLKMDDELLQMGMFGGMEDLLGGTSGGESSSGREPSKDTGSSVEDEWGTFSSFMHDSTEVSAPSDWEKEFTDGGSGSHAADQPAQAPPTTGPQFTPAQAPSTTGPQSTISSIGDSSVLLKADNLAASTGDSLTVGSPARSKPVGTSVTPTAATPTQSQGGTLLEVEAPAPQEVSSGPAALQDLFGIDLSLTCSPSTLPPPLVPTGLPPSLPFQGMAPLSTAPLNRAPMVAAWSMGPPHPSNQAGLLPPSNPAGLLPPSNPAGLLPPSNQAGLLPPSSMGSLYMMRPMQPVGTEGTFQPTGVGLGGPLRPMGVTGPMWPVGTLGAAPLLPTGTLPPASTPPRGPPPSTGDPKQKEPKPKGSATAWMNVFAHLDPLVNEKA